MENDTQNRNFQPLSTLFILPINPPFQARIANFFAESVLMYVSSVTPRKAACGARIALRFARVFQRNDWSVFKQRLNFILKSCFEFVLMEVCFQIDLKRILAVFISDEIKKRDFFNEKFIFVLFGGSYFLC